MMGKAPGNYATIEASDSGRITAKFKSVFELLAKEIEWFFEQAELGQKTEYWW